MRKGGEEPFPEVERQEGDGEESAVVDDDEDKKNPQARGEHQQILPLAIKQGVGSESALDPRWRSPWITPKTCFFDFLK